MKIPEFSIRNYQFTIILYCVLIIFGLSGYYFMPRAEDPVIKPPNCNIVVIFPGSAPKDIETLIVEPLEELVDEIDEVEHINAYIESGVASLGIHFEPGSDLDEMKTRIEESVNTAQRNFPDGVYDTRVMFWSTGKVAIMQLALISEKHSFRELKRIAENIKDDMEDISDLKNIEVNALPEEEILVEINADRLALHNIPVTQVIGAIRSRNNVIPGGSIDMGRKKFTIRTGEEYLSINEIRNTIIGAASAQPVYLKDIADINFKYKKNLYQARYNGKRAVFITTEKKEKSNVLRVERKISTILERYRNNMPVNMTLESVFNQADDVRDRLSVFFSNLLQGVILVGLVILLGVGLRPALVIMLAIPTSFVIAIGFVHLSGYAIHQITISALVVALGLLVDNAIVITQNISRFLSEGDNNYTAATKGASQVGWAVISSTATTVLAFVPMLMMKEVSGDFIRSLPVTIIYTLTASLLVALTLSPLLSFKFLKPVSKENLFIRLLNRFIEKHYSRILRFSLNHRLIVILLALGALTGSLALFPFVGVSFFPKADKPQFLVDINLPKGSNLVTTKEKALLVENQITKIPEVTGYATNIGRGNPRVYYNAMQENEKENYSQIYVKIEKDALQKLPAIITGLREEVKNIPGARIELKEFEQGPPVAAPIIVRIIGDDKSISKKLTTDVENILKSITGVVNINNPFSTVSTDIQVKIDQDKALMHGIPVADINRAVRVAMTGYSASVYRDNEGEEFDITVRLPGEGKTEFADFNNIYLPSLTGVQIPLKQVAGIEFKAGYSIIHHRDMKRSASIFADVTGRPTTEVEFELSRKIGQLEIPSGFKIVIGGESESRGESFTSLYQAAVIALFSIYGILVLQFRSFMQPLIIYAALPLAIIGAILGLLVTGFSFSFTAFIGLTSLIGIVVNNSIILVDYINILRKEGIALKEAVIEAGKTRFVPIILTTVTTIGGLLPLTLRGGTLMTPLGVVIIGGLTTSTALTLIMVPVLYDLFSKK